MYNLKRGLPALAIAGAGLMASCDKDEPDPVPPSTQHDVELKWFQDYYEEIEPTVIKVHAHDPYVRYIYLSVVNDGYFENYAPLNIENMRKALDSRIKIAPHKIRGRGNMRFKPGAAAKEDSLWYVKQGWTINQHNKQR